jgi:two-component system, OmpR family, phosphate regulon sensor histidine kinase PhoR
MQSLLLILIGLLLLGLVWTYWRYQRLRRGLDEYARDLRHITENEGLQADLPVSPAEAGDLSSSVSALLEALGGQLGRLEAERARLADVLDQLTDGVIIADADGRAVQINPAAARFFGLSQTVTGKSVAEILRHHQLIEAWQRARQTGELQAESVELPVSQQFIQLVVIADQHVPGGTLLLIQDLTRVRRLETVRRDFVSNVSHELRTPLASLKALTETLQEGALDDPPAARRFLDRMEAEVDALTQMANELLELSRIESGQVPLELKPTQPGELLVSAVERMRAQAERANLALSIDYPPDLPSIRVDGPRLEQVLVNLLHNAIKFTTTGGVTASAWQAEKNVVFSVSDTGAGIPADDLPRIFERFYKTDRARSHPEHRRSAAGGTGLGLSIAKHIVEAHGGRIWAESEEGRGSTFSFSIPAE